MDSCMNAGLLCSAYLHVGDITRAEGRDDWRDYYRKGIEALESKTPKNPNDYWRLATACRLSGQSDKAKTYFEALIEMPDSSSDQKSGAYLILGEISKAESGNEWSQYLCKGLEMLDSKQDKSVADRRKIAQGNYQLGNHGEAKQNFSAIARSRDATADQLFEAHFFLGEIGQILGDKGWSRHYRQAIRLLQSRKNRSFEDTYRLASIYKRLREYASSDRWFRKLVRECGQPSILSGCYFHLGESRYLQKKPRSAKTYFQKCIQHNPEHRKAREYLALLSAQSNQ